MKKRDLVQSMGEKIRYFRELQHMTQRALAEAAHVGENYICRLERGRQNTTVETLKDICDALKVEMKKLFE